MTTTLFFFATAEGRDSQRGRQQHMLWRRDNNNLPNDTKKYYSAKMVDCPYWLFIDNCLVNDDGSIRAAHVSLPLHTHR